METVDVRVGALARVAKHVVDLDRVHSDLYIRNRAYEQALAFGNPPKNAIEGLALWKEDGADLLLPRGYPIPFREGFEPSFVDERPDFPEAGFWAFRRTLRPKQQASIAALLGTPGDKLLCLGCGFGKTVQALYYAAHLKKKTLIVVDRDFLVEQWLREIKRALWIPMSDVGVVQGKKARIGEQLTIAMVHTLAQKDFDQDFYDQFGLIIADECHTLAAPGFSRVIPRFPGERLLLSATPKRKDGMEAAFLYHGGGLKPVYTDVKRERSSRWFFKAVPNCLTPEQETSCYRRMPGGRRGQMMLVRAKYDTFASQSLRFNQLIEAEVRRAAQSGRNILVLGTRTEQLSRLYETVGMQHSAGLAIGDVKGLARREAFSKQIIFATDKLASRALDIARLDTLFLLFPTDDDGFLRQAVGRIDREYTDKKPPFVVTFNHAAVPSLERKAHKMGNVIKEIDAGADIRWVR